MGNGKSELDEVGCEYGRILDKKVENEDKKLDQISHKQKEILELITNLKINYEKNDVYNNIGRYVITAVIAAVFGFLSSILQ
ncbi:MAG: hypothetical protein K9K32_04535 [Halanaerobiales bacterium]|nr:hypothetical protein [Halanaerobiales bacterium]